MTSTLQAPAGAARPGRPVAEDVTAILLTTPDGTPVDDLLDALAAQTQPPRRLLISGLDPRGEEADRVREHPLSREARVAVLFRTPEVAEPSRLAAVEDARQGLAAHPGHWLWFLADDSLPEADALAVLAATARRSSRVGIVGPKLVHDDDPRLLRSLGHDLTVAGRPAHLEGSALVDQGQLDLRQDVLGVPLAGALVSTALLDEVGGLDPAFAEDGVDGLDLSWRGHLAGYRVVVAPDAVVRQGPAGLGVVDPLRTRIRQRQVAMARGSSWAAPWRAFGIVLTSLLAALALLAVRRPAEAAGEWADVRAVLGAARGAGARRRFRTRRRVRPRDLGSLFAPRSTGWRSALDAIGEALDPGARSVARAESAGGVERAGRARAGPHETGPLPEELAEPGSGPGTGRRWSWPLALAVLLAALLTAWRWHPLLSSLRPGAGGVVGVELGVAETTAGGLYRSAVDGWRGDGLGSAEPAEAWLLPASLLAGMVELAGSGTSTAGVALAWLLLLAVPASVVTAYLALRRATRRRWPRAVLALGWAGLAPLATAVGDGRVGPVVVHVLAPLLVAGYAVCAARAGGARRTAAAFGTVLTVALTAQWVPVVLVPATLGGLLLLVAGRRSARWRGAVLATLPWLLLLPWLPAVVADPVRVLGGAGATVANPVHPVPVPAWQVLLLSPGPAPDPGDWAGPVLWLAVPLWLTALGSLLLPGPAGRRAGFLLGAAVLTLALALLAPRLALGVLPGGHVEAGLTVTAWPGTLLSLTGAALLLAAALLVEHLLAAAARVRRRAHGRGDRALVPLGVALTALLAFSGVGSLGLRAVAGEADALGAGQTHARGLVPASPALPAVAADQARGPAALRTLVLSPEDAAGQLRAGPAAEREAVPRERSDEQGEGTAYRLAVDLLGAEPEPARILRDRARDLAVGADAPAELVDAVGAITGQGTPAQAAARLERLGVGFVHVPADDSHPVVTLVERMPGLTRVSSPAGEVLWRTTDQQVARVRALGPDGTGALPAGSHDIDIALRTPGPDRHLHLVALVLAAVTAFLALPIGRAEAKVREEGR